jgi:hypothetical protein
VESTLDYAHRGAALFNPAYYMVGGKSDVPEEWEADTRLLLADLIPDAVPDAVALRACVLKLLPRMHSHLPPFDNAECWHAATQSDVLAHEWWNTYAHVSISQVGGPRAGSELDLTLLRKCATEVCAAQCSSGWLERINKSASLVSTKFRLGMTQENMRDATIAYHHFQQEEVMRARLLARSPDEGGRKSNPPLYTSTLFWVQQQEVAAQRAAERAALEEAAAAGELAPGSFLEPLFSDEDAGAYVANGAVARMHAAAQGVESALHAEVPAAALLPRHPFRRGRSQLASPWWSSRRSTCGSQR